MSKDNINRADLLDILASPLIFLDLGYYLKIQRIYVTSEDITGKR
jgi:hypothetical protein